jgi:hypothetical protein
LQGPEAIQAAQQLMQERRAKGSWPYAWSYPPPDAERVTAGLDSSGTIPVPVAATETEGLLYTVDDGFNFVLVSLVVEYINAGKLGAPDPGDFTWSLTKNRPAGVNTFQGSAVQGFSEVDLPLGTFQIPWPLVCGEIFAPGDQIRTLFTNTNLTPADPNFFKSILLGWRWPVA